MTSAVPTCSCGRKLRRRPTDVQGSAMKFALSSPQGRPLVRAMTLAGPAYMWLLLAVFLPLSVMLFYSFMSDVPTSGGNWSLTFQNYLTFLDEPLYR